jgi:hypothetical protein
VARMQKRREYDELCPDAINSLDACNVNFGRKPSFLFRSFTESRWAVRSVERIPQPPGTGAHRPAEGEENYA